MNDDLKTRTMRWAHAAELAMSIVILILATAAIIAFLIYLWLAVVPGLSCMIPTWLPGRGLHCRLY